MNILNRVKLIWAAITGNAVTGAKILSDHAAQLTAIATTVEALTGNEELIPLTQKAGAAAQEIGNAIDNGQDVVSAVADQVDTVATSEGSEKVAKVAKKVSKGAKAADKVLK